MNILSIVQVRVGSTRLPGKALLPILGKPMFMYAVNAAPWPKIVACPVSDHAIMDICRDEKVPFAAYLNPNDVLTRFIKAIEVAEAHYGNLFDWVLRITADCPMLTEELIFRFLHACDGEEDTIYTNRPNDPDGLDLELFPASTLYLADQLASSPYDREHVTPIIYSLIPVERVRVSAFDPRVKLSVDTRDEYLMVKSTMEGRLL